MELFHSDPFLLIQVDVASFAQDVVESSKMYADKVKPYFSNLRHSIDALEILIDEQYWELPKYREMILL